MKNKGQKFLKSLQTGKKISRKQATARWKMGNPSAWIKIYQENGIKISRQYKSKVTNGVNTRTVSYTLIQDPA
jgi:hypothetical protein